MSTVLLTGGTGFLGSRLARRMLQNNHHCIILKRSFDRIDNVGDMESKIRFVDIDTRGIDSAFDDSGIDFVIHTATVYGRANESILDMIECNLMLPLTLLDACIRHGVKLFINTDTVLDRSVNEYALSKKQLVEWMQRLSGKIKIANLKLEHMYGPGDSEMKFVTRMIRMMLRNTEEIDLTRGEQKRDFIHIDDVVNAFAVIINLLNALPDDYNEFEIGTGTTHTIRQVVTMIHRITGSTSRLNFGAVPYRENELMEANMDISGITGLGWKPEIPLQQGLEHTIRLEREGFRSSTKK